MNKRSLGQQGEEYAVGVLVKAGLTIAERNYRCPKGEMDIIANLGQGVVFVEVRARSSGVRGWAEESITAKKRQRLRAIAVYYLMEKGYRDWPPLRFDVMALRVEQGQFAANWIQGI